jgi:hypothetical protein
VICAQWVDIAGESVPGRCVFIKILSNRVKVGAIDGPYESRKGKQTKFADVIPFDGRNRVSRDGWWLDETSTRCTFAVCMLLCVHR